MPGWLNPLELSPLRRRDPAALQVAIGMAVEAAGKRDGAGGGGGAAQSELQQQGQELQEQQQKPGQQQKQQQEQAAMGANGLKEAGPLHAIFLHADVVSAVWFLKAQEALLGCITCWSCALGAGETRIQGKSVLRADIPTLCAQGLECRRGAHVAQGRGGHGPCYHRHASGLQIVNHACNPLLFAYRGPMCLQITPCLACCPVPQRTARMNQWRQAECGLDPAVLPPDLPVYSGHYHLPHTVRDTNITYIGSPYQVRRRAVLPVLRERHCRGPDTAQRLDLLRVCI